MSKTAVPGLSQAELEALADQWPDLAYVEARGNSDADALVGRTTTQIMAMDQASRRYTLYVTWTDGVPELQWDVSGWPAGYKPPEAT